MNWWAVIIFEEEGVVSSGKSFKKLK